MNDAPTAAPWRAHVLTLFPDMFPGTLGHSLAARARARGVWSLDVHDIRAHGDGAHRTVDDVPFGGGAGMVMRPDVADRAIEAARRHGADDLPLVYLTPRGRTFGQPVAAELARGPGVLLLCGRYEGVDERVLEARGAREITIGDYVLSGGELPAIVLLDACVRLLPGTMGAAESAATESFADGALLEHAHYTRPAEWNGRRVPDILLSGNHAAIRRWRAHEAREATRMRRPDLTAPNLTASDRAPSDPIERTIP